MDLKICEKVYEDLLESSKIDNSFYGFSLRFNRLGGLKGEIIDICNFLSNLSIRINNESVYKILELRKNLISELYKNVELQAHFDSFQEILKSESYVAGCGIPAPILWVSDVLLKVAKWIYNKIKEKLKGKEEEINKIINKIDGVKVVNINIGTIKENSTVKITIKDVEEIIRENISEE